MDTTPPSSDDMPFPFDIDDLLTYTDWERAQWRAWFRANGAATLETDLGAHNTGRIHTVGELIRHIFSAELRYVERSLRQELTDTSTIPADDPATLFAFGDRSRAALRQLLATFPDADWAAPREMTLASVTRTMTPRTFVLQAITHEIRHWAQIAAFLRQAGYQPGFRDLIASPLFGPEPV
jgi:uncharacterized damage-inducible protein DinB